MDTNVLKQLQKDVLDAKMRTFTSKHKAKAAEEFEDAKYKLDYYEQYGELPKPKSATSNILEFEYNLKEQEREVRDLPESNIWKMMYRIESIIELLLHGTLTQAERTAKEKEYSDKAWQYNAITGTKDAYNTTFKY